MSTLVILDGADSVDRETWGAALSFTEAQSVTALAVGPNPVRVPVNATPKTIFRIDGHYADVAQVACRLHAEAAFDVVLWPNTLDGQLAATAFSAAVNGPCFNNVTAVRAADGKVEVCVPVFGGQVQAWAQSVRGPISVMVLQQSLSAALVLFTGVTEQLTPTATERPQERVVQEPLPHGGSNLQSSSRIVAGGRGIGGPDGVRVLNELATRLDAEVGASRAAVDAGWLEPDRQIGQTGVHVAPDLYIAIGISGASQHLAGMARARHIVAINTDPDAPMVRHADIAVIAPFLPVIRGMIRELDETPNPTACVGGRSNQEVAGDED